CSILCLRQHGRREGMWNVMFADHNLHVHAESVGRPQHLNHSPLRWPPRNGKAGDLDVHGHALERVLRIFQFSGLQRPAGLLPKHPMWRIRHVGECFLTVWDQNRPTQALVPWSYVITPKCFVIITMVTLCIVKDPYDGGIASRQHPCNAPGAASIAPRKCLIYKD